MPKVHDLVSVYGRICKIIIFNSDFYFCGSNGDVKVSDGKYPRYSFSSE